MNEINIETLPMLNEYEQNNYLRMYKKGSLLAREKLILHNVRLVKYIVLKYFGNVYEDKNDLLSIGIIGLEKAIDTYEVDNQTSFLLYISRGIYNEIAFYLRKEKQDKNNISLNEVLNNKKKFIEFKMFDIIEDKKDYFENIEIEELLDALNKRYNRLTPRERIIMKMSLGIDGSPKYNLKEISARLGLSNNCVSFALENAINKIREKLVNEGYFEKRKML